MKSIRTVLFVLSVASVLSLPASAAEKKTAGPNGGRILAGAEPRAEFFVTAERKVQITFLDAAGKPVAPGDQVVTVTAGDRAAPTTLAFAKTGNALLSTAPLPAGKLVPAVVQIKAGPAAKPAVARFNVDLAKCGECKLAEYACICAH